MARKSVKARQTQLGDWADSVPEEVRDAAEDYHEKQSEVGKARGKANSAKDHLKKIMRENSVEKVRLQDGRIVEITSEDHVKIRKAQEPVTVGGGDEESSDDDE